ncbi:MAG: universal stress protein [Micromonosporaceae bacterium]
MTVTRLGVVDSMTGVEPGGSLGRGQLAGRSAQVVVGIAGSQAGDTALDWAINEAQTTGADLVVCHAYTPEHILRPPPAGAVGAAGDEQAQRRLDAAVATARRRLGPGRVRAELGLGDAATVLIEASVGTAMLVVGRHGHFEQTARLSGSTAHRVAAHASCSVVVRPLVSGVPGPFTGHVVVGLDETAAGLAALEFGFRYAAQHELPVAAVHVAPGWSGEFWTDDEMLQASVAEEPEALTRLAVRVESWRARYPQVPVKRAGYGGDPVRGLLRAAGGARLLVLGDRPHEGLRRLMLGAVSQGVVGHADCPVAVVHPASGRPGGD